MADEIATGSAGATDGGGHQKSRNQVSSPLQARSQFFKNWDWQSVVSINQGTCQRTRAQHGLNSETGVACAKSWEDLQYETLTLAETLDQLRHFHKRAPFFSFNGNTFATIGRELALALFSDLPPVRKRETASAIAHYIAGVLDQDAMVEIVESLCETADWKIGDRVKTLRGTIHGMIVGVLPDGRIVWKPDGSNSELTGLFPKAWSQKNVPRSWSISIRTNLLHESIYCSRNQILHVISPP
jgi:hypothetical protein